MFSIYVVTDELATSHEKAASFDSVLVDWAIIVKTARAIARLNHDWCYFVYILDEDTGEACWSEYLGEQTLF